MMQTEDFQGFGVELEEPGIAWITINQPHRLNSMNVGLKRDLIDAARDLARELANGPQVAMRLLKRSIYNAAEMSFAASLDEIAAVKEKRPPRFNKWLEEGTEGT